MRFDAYADVVLAYFELFRSEGGNLRETWRKIDAAGPFFPEFSRSMLPESFRCPMGIENRSSQTGQLMPSESGLRFMLTNVAYLGHWTHQLAVVIWHNHEAIIPTDLFMYAFNKLSPSDFLGEPNPNYVPYRPWTRYDKSERPAELPTYAYLAYSDDLPDQPHRRLSYGWENEKQYYKYVLCHNVADSCVWSVKADLVDNLVDDMLRERLQATTVDEAAWQAALESVHTVDQTDIRRIKTAIRQAEMTKDNLIANLGMLSHPDMVQRAEARYEAAEREITALQAELKHLQAAAQQPALLIDARPALERVVTHWDQVPRDEKRSLFEAFAHFIHIHKQDRQTKIITVHWRDGSTSTRSISYPGYFWEPQDLEQLRQMIESDVDQWEILRSFPDYNWRALKERYRYHFGEGHWRKAYAGKRSYFGQHTWADTKEYKAEQAANAALPQLPASMTPTGNPAARLCAAR